MIGLNLALMDSTKSLEDCSSKSVNKGELKKVSISTYCPLKFAQQS